MRVILLAPAVSSHAIKWANGLANAGLEVHLVSLHKCHLPLLESVKIYYLPFGSPLGYFFAVPSLRRLVKLIKPDVINVHYATGYGTLASLANIHPRMISVWGTDIYQFPNKSSIHKWILKMNLLSAETIAATSNAMATRVKRLCPSSQVFVTPFGIDEDKFSPKKKERSNKNIIIGTVKTLSYNYGIDILITAFSEIINNQNYLKEKLQLVIVGDGPDKKLLMNQVKRSNIADNVKFVGAVPHSIVPEILNEFDIFVSLSRQESFGVAILEANACGLPVVVTDAEGPLEITVHKKTGLVVKKESVPETVQALSYLIQNPDIRNIMGQYGRQHVLSHYTWKKSLNEMIFALKATINRDYQKNPG